MLTLQLMPERHKVLSQRTCPLLGYLKRRLRGRVAKALGAYVHMLTGRLVFFLWIDQRKGICSEGITLEHWREFGTEQLELLLSQFTPSAFAYARHERNRLLAIAKAYKQKLADDVRHSDEVRQWYIRGKGSKFSDHPNIELDYCGSESAIEAVGKQKHRNRAVMPATTKEPV